MARQQPRHLVDEGAARETQDRAQARSQQQGLGEKRAEAMFGHEITHPRVPAAAGDGPESRMAGEPDQQQNQGGLALRGKRSRGHDEEAQPAHGEAMMQMARRRRSASTRNTAGNCNSCTRNGIAASSPMMALLLHTANANPTRNGPVVKVAMAWLASPSSRTTFSPASTCASPR